MRHQKSNRTAIAIAIVTLIICLCGCGSTSRVDDGLLGSWRYEGFGQLDTYTWTFRSDGSVKMESQLTTVEYPYSAENGILTISYKTLDTKNGKYVVTYKDHPYTYQYGKVDGAEAILLQDQLDQTQRILYKAG